MVSKVLKEILLTIILIIIVILILAVLLYDYNPIVKTIPESVAYEIEKDVSEEINTEVVPNDTKVIITYEVDNSDLNNSQDYNPGKKNPFIKYDTQEKPGSTLNGNGNTSGNGTSNNSASGNGSNSNGGYFQNTSTK